MVTKQFLLTPELARQVDRMVEAGRFSDGSEYIHDLLKRDAERMEAIGVLADRLTEGIDSGEPIEITPHYWGNKKRSLSDNLNRTDEPAA